MNVLINVIKNYEGEVLIEGGVPAGYATEVNSVHMSYVRSGEALFQDYRDRLITKAQLDEELSKLRQAYSQARIFGNLGRGLTVTGAIFTVYDLAKATEQSINQESIKPVSAEVIRQVGGWGAAIAGAKVGGVTGAALGIETGLGASLANRGDRGYCFWCSWLLGSGLDRR